VTVLHETYGKLRLLTKISPAGFVSNFLLPNIWMLHLEILYDQRARGYSDAFFSKGQSPISDFIWLIVKLFRGIRRLTPKIREIKKLSNSKFDDPFRGFYHILMDVI